MEVTKVIDYAYPTMMAEKALKDMHNAMLEKRYEDAMGFLMDTSINVVEAYKAVLAEWENARKAPARP